MGRRPVIWMLLACLVGAELAGQTTLFGRRTRGLDTESGRTESPMPGPEEPAAPAKPAPAKEPDDPFAAPSGKPDKEGKDGKRGDKDKRDKDGKRDDDKEPDQGVRIRPVKLAEPARDLPVAETVEFRLSRVDKPLARETGAMFRQAWAAFRAQHRRVDDGFERLPGVTFSLRATFLQDLGEGRWLVDAAWNNPGHHAWCAPGAHATQAIVVLADPAAKPAAPAALTVTLVGLVDARFDCAVPPAAGRRITLRRHAFLETPPLPDDAATREAFRAAVARGDKLHVVVAVERDCKACNGLGFIRRPVPGKIQDARDPCPAGCQGGSRRTATRLNFAP